METMAFVSLSSSRHFMPVISFALSRGFRILLTYDCTAFMQSAGAAADDDAAADAIEAAHDEYGARARFRELMR